jgi:hypothetical protein
MAKTNTHQPYGVGDVIKFTTSDLRYEILDAQTTSNGDGTKTFHYRVKRKFAKPRLDVKTPTVTVVGYQFDPDLEKRGIIVDIS